MEGTSVTQRETKNVTVARSPVRVWRADREKNSLSVECQWQYLGFNVCMSIIRIGRAVRRLRYGYVVLVVLLILGLTACSGPVKRAANKTTDTRSSVFTTDADKIAFLEQYLLLASPIHATEFHIVYHDNASGGVAGPSDWDIQAVMLVSSADLARWTEGLQAVAAQDADLAWAYALLPREQRWRLTSQPVVYQRSGALVAVFAAEGIVFKRVWTR